MKRKIRRWKLKKWVENTLLGVNAFAFIVMCSECESLKLFIITHLIALVIFVLNTQVLYKYTDLFKEEI